MPPDIKTSVYFFSPHPLWNFFWELGFHIIGFTFKFETFFWQLGLHLICHNCYFALVKNIFTHLELGCWLLRSFTCYNVYQKTFMFINIRQISFWNQNGLFVRSGKISPNQETGLEIRGCLKVLNDTRLILND